MSLIKTPRGLDEIIATFGSLDDPHFEQKNIASFALPYPLRYAGKEVFKARCHRLLVPTFIAVFTAIKVEGLTHAANDYSGIYARRPIRGFSSHPSTHSWGIAIDLEADGNQLGTVGTMHRRVSELFEQHGFFWGGNFKSRKDPMHFQYARNY